MSNNYKQNTGKGTMAGAIHAHDGGDNHATAVTDLNVIIGKDGTQYIAQGVELYYFACGQTLDDVKNNFVHGMVSTMRAYIDKYGSIEKFLRPSPKEDIEELKGDSYSLDCLAVLDLSEELNQTELHYLPYKRISYKGKGQELEASTAL